MPRLFSILILTQVICYAALSQIKNIDSLYVALPNLKNTARIDCLNEIAFYHLGAHNKDSVEFYTTSALKDAKTLHYAHGIAVSLFQTARNETHYGNDKVAERLTTESLQWYKLTGDKKYIEIAYYQMGREFFAQSKWDSALANLKQSLYWAKKADNCYWIVSALSLIGEVYREGSNYGSAFEIFKQELQTSEQCSDTLHLEGALCNIGDLYQAIEDYPTALAYYARGFNIAKPQDLTIWDYTIHAELFSLVHQFDSALHYYSFIDTTKLNAQSLPVFLVSKGEYFLARKEFDSALIYFLRGTSNYRRINSVNQTKRALLDIAKAFYGEKNNSAALDYARQSLSMAQQANCNQYIRDAYYILYAVCDRTHKTDSAYFYYRKYILMKDSVLSDQTKGRFVAYNYEQKINLLNQEEQLEQKQLKAESLQKKILAEGILIIVILGFVILRTLALKRKNEKLESEKNRSALQGKASELEMQALRSQMNPHFIFNCLSSINRFILKNKTEEASDYLTKFSMLIRMVLNNSNQSFVSLEDELETLRLYLEMEKLRFKNSFDYSFTYTNAVDLVNIFIPPLLLQPFAENAIWHGLMHKQGKGFLSFDFSVENKFLSCVITDNGVGRAQAEMLKSKSLEKQRSMGLKITSERLSLLNSNSHQQTLFTIEDLKDENGNATGTRVHLKIFYKELTAM